MKTRAIILCALLAGGCETMGGPVECHGQNWYRVGLNDGKADAKAERERYVKACGADFNAKQYDEGYKAGAAR